VPSLRTVVLRGLLGDGTPYFFTDARSRKVDHLDSNPPHLAMLAWFEATRQQFRLSGLATVHGEHAAAPWDTLRVSLWARLPPAERAPFFGPAPGRLLVDAPGAACVLHADGTVDCWDGALHRVQGLPPLTRFVFGCPAAPPPGQTYFAGVTDGGVRCAFRPNGADVVCGNGGLVWERGACGTAELGLQGCSVIGDGGVVCTDGPPFFRHTPVPLPEPAKKVVMSQLQACALLVSGQVYCWGYDYRTGRLLLRSLRRAFVPAVVRRKSRCARSPVEHRVEATSAPLNL
jgi:hypothetical protein